jgi:hypothetical protein
VSLDIFPSFLPKYVSCQKAVQRCQIEGFSWEEKLVAPLIAAPNGEMHKKKEDKGQGKNGHTVILFCWQFVLLFFVLRSLAFSARQNT